MSLMYVQLSMNVLFLTVCLQTELAVNTNVVVSNIHRGVANTHTVISDVHHDVMNTHAMVADIHHNMLKGPEGANNQHQSVSEICIPFQHRMNKQSSLSRLWPGQ